MNTSDFQQDIGDIGLYEDNIEGFKRVSSTVVKQHLLC